MPRVGPSRSVLVAVVEVFDVVAGPEWEDAEFEDLDGADPEVDLATFWVECRLADEAVASAGLDDTFVSRRGYDISLRWVYVHMIEEYARHNGHADLIRERIDGVVGDSGDLAL